VELERVVGGQADVESLGHKLGNRVALVAEKEAVVAQRRHGHTDLTQVVQVLDDWRLENHIRYPLFMEIAD